MKLHQFKAIYITQLTLYNPESNREKELKDLLISKIYNLRTMTLPDLAHTLYRIIEHENVSESFKDLCKFMLEDIKKIDELYSQLN
ncbi:MAG: hypothetical protein DRP01_07015 [Archaeoglobales archaeon]|nr:MAG: hypothetical protein DRP01_07015 [Archaeoglobales archaeon]